MRRVTDEEFDQATLRDWDKLNRKEKRMVKYQRKAMKHFMVPGPKHAEASAKLVAPAQGNAHTGTHNGVIR